MPTVDSVSYTHLFVQRTLSAHKYELPFSQESDGTRKLIAALPVILLALREGRMVIIDELDEMCIRDRIYMDEDCDLDAGCPNFVLYGHHMKNGSMFAALEKYTSEEFYREHPEILFDTLEEIGRYQVAAVFKMPGAQITEAFAGTLLAATEEDYNAFIAYAKEHSLYDTGVTPQWPEQLLTLGTCEYTYEDGRLFVVGRAVPALK